MTSILSKHLKTWEIDGGDIFTAVCVCLLAAGTVLYVL